MSLAILWTTPQSVPTACEEALSQHKDVEIEHEPFNDVYYFSKNNISSGYGVQEDKKFLTGEKINSSLLHMLKDENTFFLVKELAFQGNPYISSDILEKSLNFFIIRKPEVILDSLIALKPDFTEDEFGFTALLQIYEKIKSINSQKLYVIEGDCFRSHPIITLVQICRFLNIPYDPQMMEWANGKIRTWDSSERESQNKYHTRLESSKGILPPDRYEPLNLLKKISPVQHKIFVESKDIYEKLLSEAWVLPHVPSEKFNDLIIRAAKQEDVSRIQEIVEISYRHYISRIGRRPAPMDDDYYDIIQKGCTWVLEDKDGISGIVTLVFYADGVLVENLAVHPSKQGLGYGKKLIKFSEKVALDLGFNKILGYTNEKMTENIEIYQHLGYTITKKVIENGFRRVFFEKSLVSENFS